MKTWAITFGLAVSTSFSSLADGANARITFRVGDDSGSIVTGATVRMSTLLRWEASSGFGKQEFAKVGGKTDTNGLIVLEMECLSGEITYAVSTGGQYFDNMLKMNVAGTDYYRDTGSKIRFTNVVDKKYEPWNPMVELQLKKVINPVPMYAKNLRGFPIPACNEPLGYDLENGDWLPPYGGGSTADFVFRLDRDLGDLTLDQVQYFDATLSLTFSNEDDGIQEVADPPPQGSVFHLPRYAPENGYTNYWSLKIFRNSQGANDIMSPQTEEMNYFFRVRTKKDDEGKIISARYGKIRGPLWFGIVPGKAELRMRFYFNPTPNDRNMEFDPKRNLFTDLAPLERVNEP